MVKEWSKQDILSSLSRIGTISRHNGNELLLQNCPYCGKNDSKFSVNIEKQVFRCLHANSCNKTGKLFKLFSDNNCLPIAGKKSYTRPKADPAIKSPDDFYNRYQQQRGIKPDVLKKYQVGQKVHNETEYIVYMYYNEKSELVNRKYRTFDKSNMWTEKDAEQIYYGLNHVDFNEKQLIVVSGEDDCHALFQEQFTNVVSVPFGDGVYTDAMHAINERFNEIILMFDADPPGQQGAFKFAQKAGIHKCKNVVLPFKDARDCILNGIEFFGFQREIQQAKTFKLPFEEKIFIPSWDNEPENIPSIVELCNVGILSKGNISTIVALPGSGKSTIVSALCASSYDSMSDTLGIRTPLKTRILLLDTEQSKKDNHKNWKFFLRRCGIEKPDPAPANILWVSVTGTCTVNENWDAFSYYLETFRPELVIIDCVTDFVINVNDTEESNNAVKRFKSIAHQKNIGFLFTMHPNPNQYGGSEKARGHFGSEVLRKSESVLLLEKKDGIHSISPDFSFGKNRSGSTEIRHSFTWNDDSKMHVSCDTPVQKKAKGKTAEEQDCVLDAMEKKEWSYTGLVDLIIEKTGKAESTAKRKIAGLKKGKKIIQTENDTYKVNITEEISNNWMNQ